MNDKLISLRLSREDYLNLLGRARHCRMSLSAYVRAVLAITGDNDYLEDFISVNWKNGKPNQANED